MAKKRRVSARATAGVVAQRHGVADGERPIGPGGLQIRSLAVGLLGAAVVYVAYYPSDSIAVEKGDALWFGFLVMAMASIAWATTFTERAGQPNRHERSSAGRGGGGNATIAAERNVDNERRSQVVRQWSAVVLDVAPWLLAGWMMIAAFASSPPGNLRMSTNEAWLWFSAAAVFTAGRRLLASLRTRQAVLLLLIVCTSASAVHGMHQYFISLPENRQQYERDPDHVLQLAGVDAPAGSTERMVFENRLLDGGPTGTFALANSLAAVLLIGAIAAMGVLRFRWFTLNWPVRVLWSCLLLLCAACLMAARSRSAALSMLLGMGLLFLVGSRLRRPRQSVVLTGLAAVVAVGLIAALALALFGNPEWFEEAPASLAFRFQYWRSTWQLALDRPLFAAGPGNFQSIYERYREASATEQIAEPHNFVFETLASGGFVALGILATLGVSGLAFICSSGKNPCESLPANCGAAGDRANQCLWFGAGLALALVWLVSFGTRFAPDIDAHLFAVPTAMMFAVFLWPSVVALASRDLDWIAGIMLASLLLHLLVAGGWTVPGVAIVVWLLSALLTRSAAGPSRATYSRRLSDWIPMFGVVAAGLLLLGSIYWMSLKPVRRNAAAMRVAEEAQSRGQIGRAKAALQTAIAADPWSVEAAIWMADFYRWHLVFGDDTAVARENWESSLAEVKRRAGDDPAVFRIVGAQQMHLYQRFGQQRDLAAAAETFQLAAQWSPSHQWLAAQVAVIESALGKTDRAAQMAGRALELSLLGGNIERALYLQQVYLPERIGPSAQAGPVRRSAQELLANQLNRGGVQADK